MTLQVLPPELLEQTDRIEKVEEKPYWKPSSLKDGESEEFRLLGCYETGHAIMGWQYASECQIPRLVIFVSMASLLLVLILVTPMTSLEKPTGLNQTDQRLMEALSRPRRFLAWVATSAARGRLEVLFIEQKSLREQLTEILTRDR
jgi:hypothetical protein